MSLVSAGEGENRRRLVSGLLMIINQVRDQDKDLGTQAYLSCSLGATESNLRLGERRTLKLRTCNSFICWCRMVSLKESRVEVIFDVGTINWVFETFECSRWNRVWIISKRCSMKILEGNSVRRGEH